MDMEGDIARVLDLCRFWKFRASLDSLVLFTCRLEYQYTTPAAFVSSI
jgi:hypothetical protein